MRHIIHGYKQCAAPAATHTATVNNECSLELDWGRSFPSIAVAVGDTHEYYYGHCNKQ